jgi:hypothetical protein
VHPVEEALAPLVGLPSWLVQKGHGSFITFEFGQPEVDIHGPRMLPVFIEGAPPEAMRRCAHVHGQWHLWIHCCQWSLSLNGTQLAYDESDDVTINRALGVLNGQAITDVSMNPDDASTGFTFDLGCVLMTTPAPDDVYDFEPAEQWMLYQPSHEVLTVRSDGRYQLCQDDSSPDDSPWLPLG